MQSAIVTDEAEFPELGHEEIDALPRSTNHFREHLLRYFGKHFLRLGFLAVASQQQKSASQTFLAGVKELIDQIFIDANIVARLGGGSKMLRGRLFPCDLAIRGLAISFLTLARVPLR